MTQTENKTPTPIIPPLVAEFGLQTVRNVASEKLFDFGDGRRSPIKCRACSRTFEPDRRDRTPHFALTSHARKHFRSGEAFDIYVDDQLLATGWQSARVMPTRKHVEQYVARAARIREIEPGIADLTKRVKPIEGELRKIEREREKAENAIIQMVRRDRADVPEFAERCKDVIAAGKQIKALTAKLDEIASEYDDDVVDSVQIVRHAVGVPQ